jgi:hypothetical protein
MVKRTMSGLNFYDPKSATAYEDTKLGNMVVKEFAKAYPNIRTRQPREVVSTLGRLADKGWL